MCSGLVNLLFFVAIIQVFQNYSANGEVNKYPYMGLIGYKSSFGIIWKCGGTSVSPTSFLTAANCCRSSKTVGPPVTVRTGYGEEEVDKCVTKNDLAIITLKKKINGSVFPRVSNVATGNDKVAAGWGGLSFENQLHATINDNLVVRSVTTSDVSKNSLKAQLQPGSACIVDEGGPLLAGNSIIGVLKEWKNCGEGTSNGEYILLENYRDFLMPVLPQN